MLYKISRIKPNKIKLILNQKEVPIERNKEHSKMVYFNKWMITLKKQLLKNKDD